MKVTPAIKKTDMNFNAVIKRILCFPLLIAAQKKLEMFAREEIGGWDCWGDDVDSTVSISWS